MMKPSVGVCALFGLGLMAAAYVYSASDRKDEIVQNHVTAPMVDTKPQVRLNFASGQCVDASKREVYIVAEGDNPWTIAQGSSGNGEDLFERFVQILRLNNIREYSSQRSTGKDPLLLQIGQKLVFRNNGLVPKLSVPKQVVLDEGQELVVNFGLEGMLCDSKVKMTQYPSGARIDQENNSFYWRPGFLQTGTYTIAVTTTDLDAGIDEVFQIIVKGKDYEFTTSGPRRVTYWIAGTDRGSAITLDKKTYYELKTQAIIDSWMLDDKTSDLEKRFANLQQKASGYDLSGNKVWEDAVDDVRRRIATGNNPDQLRPFEFSAGRYWYESHPFPVLGKRIQ